MTDPQLDWIDTALITARPQAIGALLRYFRNLETAEEAYQEACLRALKTGGRTVRRGIRPPGSSSSDAMSPSTRCGGAAASRRCRPTS